MSDVSTVTESQTQAAILLEFGSGYPLRIWRQNTGAHRVGNRMIRYGVPGQADISGVIQGGRALFIEVKSPTGRQSAQQRKFQAMVESLGGLYILARSVLDVHEALSNLDE